MNSIKDFIKLVSEAPVTSSDGTPVRTGTGGTLQTGTSTPAAPPAAGTNPWEGTDNIKAAAWAKLSPQVKQKIGMADPTDPIIVGRMVRGGFLSGKPVTDANPDGTPKTVQATTTTTAPVPRPSLNIKPGDYGANTAQTTQAAQPAQASQTHAKNPEMQKKIDRVKSIVGITSTTESIIFKSSIARQLIESFDLGIEEVTDSPAATTSAREELDALWAELSKALDTPGALSPEQRKEVEGLANIVSQYQAANPLKTNQTAQTATTAKPQRQLAPQDPNVMALQNWLISKGYNVGPHGADGRYGDNTNKAVRAYIDNWQNHDQTARSEFGTLFGKVKGNSPSDVTTGARSTPAQGGVAAKPTAATSPAPAPAPGGVAAKPSPTISQADADALRAQRDAFGRAYVAMKNNPSTPPDVLAQMEKNITDIGAKMKAAGISESTEVSYSEDQSLASIIHLAGLR